MNHRVLGVENSATRFFLTAGVSGLADAGEIRYASLSCARVDCAQRAKVNWSLSGRSDARNDVVRFFIYLPTFAVQPQKMRQGNHAPWHCHSGTPKFDQHFEEPRKTRSRLNRDRPFQVNTHILELFKIYMYKACTLLHRSNLRNSAKCGLKHLVIVSCSVRSMFCFFEPKAQTRCFSDRFWWSFVVISRYVGNLYTK